MIFRVVSLTAKKNHVIKIVFILHLGKLLFFFLPVRSKSRLINYLTEKHENATSNEQEPSTKAINNSSG